MQKHQWREQDGEEIRLWRANYHGGKWSLYTRAKEEDDWCRLDPPSTEDWEALRDVLWRKYQRGRCAWNLISKIDKMLGRPNEGPQ
ncbi:hypothetical protein N9A94_03920 [Akkermansiaceae bacterium]|nr:hypothetical protein [Akkermansiaceae bacterium]MDB4538120.1 hypothetical protein [Akkermansiaceae bacterium]MDB4544674.1 hypothetical protein [Akkermansiaceae bacterium]